MSDLGIQLVTVTTGGKSQLAIAADMSRRSLQIQPQEEACLVNFGATAGIQATGTLTFSANAANAETIVVNGITFTFKTSPGAGEVQIGAAKEDTATNFAAILNASVNAAINIATYSVSGAVVTVTYIQGGTGGNAYTLAASSAAHVGVSGGTLTGGSNTIGGIAIAQNVAQEWHARDFGQIVKDVYITSLTTGKRISYLASN
jgi:hypothetical protein